MLRTENVEDSPLSIQRSRSAGGVRRRNVEQEGSQTRKDDNPLGWLARGRIAGGRGFRWAGRTFCRRKKSRNPNGSGGFIEPNKTVVK